MKYIPNTPNPDSPSTVEQDDLFQTIAPELSSQIGGGYWHSASFPTPSRRMQSHAYGRLPSSHRLAAQRLDHALFA
ncbi:MAG: hypothetical protein AAGI45_22805 [Cyanobacteria bacterium P01_H01_bin.26]